ncbi:group 1 glycosyl transferase [Candidatus Omnitrophus magneticus]|uniref:Group 1 glycosyl transferase n=1 Tax=Candidatus Omnitrophus magneticus TaxID=1609969 RepID=A0A0F0CNP2_9BACT|nr:group 1 glycosyl transferase [Candidatus Omnitrophus magneticus]
MKVAFVSRFPRDINTPHGGVESATVNLALALSVKKNIELHIVVLDKKQKHLEIEKKKGITTHRIPAPNTPQIFDILGGPGMRELISYLNSLKPDIVHFHETYGLLARGLSMPHIFTVHGFDSENILVESGIRGRFKIVRSWLWGLIEKIGLSQKKYIISITPYVKKFIEKKTTARIFDIDNAIDKKFFNIKRGEIDYRIFSAGWISQRKNTKTLITAFALSVKAMPDKKMELIIAGAKRDTAYLKEVEDEIKKYNLENKIFLIGSVSQDKIKEELSRAGLFILASYQENAPMAVAEAMASALPVIVSNRCGMPYMVKDGESGFLVEPSDAEDIAKKIEILFRDEKLRLKMGLAAKNRAIEKFSPDNVAEKTIKAYEAIL